MKINVTVRDIALSNHRSDMCMVARAMHRHAKLRGAKIGTFSVQRKDGGFDLSLPRPVTELILAHDRGEKIVPFSFEYEP